MNVDIDDKEMAMAVLNGLPARFESLIVALDALGSEDKMFSLDFVKSRLLQEEQRAEMKDKLLEIWVYASMRSHAVWWYVVYGK